MNPGNDQTIVCILAGGLSQRMGRDKARMRLGRHTLVGYLRATLKDAEWPVRVLRRDIVKRCGPLGGIYTALHRTRADVVIFLACDMPFVSIAWLRKLRRGLRKRDRAVFTVANGKAGFPLILRRSELDLVKGQMAAGKFALQDLALESRARQMRQPGATLGEAWNINTPEEWLKAVEKAASQPQNSTHKAKTTNRAHSLHG